MAASAAAEDDLAQRVLILAPGGGNAASARRVLQRTGIEACVCDDVEAMAREMEAGAGALLLTLEALTSASLDTMRRLLARQPDWSRLPVVVLDGKRARRSLRPPVQVIRRNLPGAIMLQRPMRPLVLISVLESALTARRAQCRTRDLLAQQADDVRHRDRFLAMLGHELRNPLAPIRYTLDLLNLQRGQLPESLRAGVDLMDRQTARLNQLVNELLDVARITQGHITLHRSRVDLTHVVHEALVQAEPLIRQRGQQLHLDLPDSAIVEGDEQRLVQVMVNLIGNAAKYTPPGGAIDVVCTRPDAPRQAHSSGWVELRVRDTGQGIAPELMPRLFDPFVQAERAQQTTVGGLGLGLALVRQLVQAHGGRIEARSGGVGQGSEFIVQLPALENAAPAAGEDGETVGGAVPRRRVLVVDDEADVTESLVWLLADLGQEVRGVNDSLEAIAVARDWHPELVLMDLEMPGIDGFEAARRLRSAHGHHLYLVALSGYGSETHGRRSRAAGFDQHLLKPIGTAELRVLLAVTGTISDQTRSE